MEEVPNNIPPWEKRPAVWGIGDRKHKLSTPYERAYRSTVKGTVTYHGFADVGSAEDHGVWQISETTYDADGNLVSVKWAVNAQGQPSSNYEFAWASLETYKFG